MKTKRTTRSATMAKTASNALAIATSTDAVDPSAPSPSLRTNYFTFSTPEGRQWSTTILMASLAPDPSGLTLSDFPPDQYPLLPRGGAGQMAFNRQRNNPKSWEKAKKALNAAIRLGLQNVSDLPPGILRLLDVPAQGGDAAGAPDASGGVGAAVGIAHAAGGGRIVAFDTPGRAAPGIGTTIIQPSPAAAAAASAAAAAPLVPQGQPVASNTGLVTHDQVNTAFGAVNAMMERFGEGQAKRDAALAKRDAHYDKDRKQSQQVIAGILGRTEGLEKEVGKQGGQISDIQVRQDKTDRRLKKQGGTISTLQVNQRDMGSKVRDLEEGRRTQNVRISDLQESDLQNNAQLGEHDNRITVLEQVVLLSPGGPLALEAATKAADAATAAAAAAKRKPPSTPNTGTAADGNGGGDSSPSSSSFSSSPSPFFFADDSKPALKSPFTPSTDTATDGNAGGDVSPSSSTSSFSDKKPSPEPSPGNARGSSTTAGGGGTASDGDDLSAADSDIFFVRPIRRDGLSQADEDEADEGMKELEAIRKSLEKTLRGAGYDV